MKKVTFCLFFPLALLIACGSEPEPSPEQPVAAIEQTPATEAEPAVVEEPVVVVEEPIPLEFDPHSISQEEFDTTKIEVRRFIGELNKIISNRNFKAWTANLSDEYFKKISSPQYLASVNEYQALKQRNIVLKTAQDYFLNVIVPSRANIRTDTIEIEFIGEHRVKAFTEKTTIKGSVTSQERAGLYDVERVYDIEKIGNAWKIIN